MKPNFEVTLRDGSVTTEESRSWSSMSEESRVGYFGATKTVFLCTEDVASVTVRHGELEQFMDVPEGHRVYQAVRAESSFLPDGSVHERSLGRVVGLVSGGEVVEERFLDGLGNAVRGLR